jgi:hypothetical protein
VKPANLHSRIFWRVLGAALFLTIPSPAQAITREQVIARAKAYAYHPWRCTAANLTASCSSTYRSAYVPGDYLGLPYDWGGYVTLFEFDQEIARGAGAGSYASDGVLSCTTGVDCSGFVSKAWDTAHYGTATLETVSTVIPQSSILAGDVFNKPNYHVVLYSHTLGNGEPVFYESIGYNVQVNVTGGWSWVSGYTPRRFRDITGTTGGDPLGTPTNPIPITSFPFTDSRDTRQAPSDLLDRCGAATDKDESGPEYVYRLELTQPGRLTISVSDDVNPDIDVHLYTSMNTSDCIDRHDSAISRAVDCGTYYVVADTYVSSGTPKAGQYTLTVTFSPSGQPCGSGPPAYNFAGRPGAPCAFPGHPDLPFCNPNLGVDTCLYTSGASATSFCSRACGTGLDCTDFPGGCCGELGSGEQYCFPAAWCSPTPADGGAAHDGGPLPQDAGSPSLDAGLPRHDAGVTDAGVTDAGVSDGGGTRPDGGSPSSDAGIPGPGGEEPEPPTARSGGGCQSVAGETKGFGAVWGLAAVLAVVFGYRRIRRSSPRD